MRDIPLDTRTILQRHLNIEEKVRSNLLPWNGQFSPQLVHAFLHTYSAANNVVLDPFMGSGTVLIEAATMGLEAVGTEINPAAFLMAQIYLFTNMSPAVRNTSLETVHARLMELFEGAPLFCPRPVLDDRACKRVLTAAWSSESNPNAKVLLAVLVTLLDFYKPGLTAAKILATWGRIRNCVDALAYSSAPLRIANADARNLPLGTASIDFVITSPPYINVFNYHQQFRASTEALGWDLLHVAKSEIGSNRKNRGNRFLTVVQYCLEIGQVLEELFRVCKPDSRVIFVVGRESNVRKTRFFNGDIVARLASRCTGFVPEVRQERVFMNRFGAPIYEDILHLRRGQAASPISGGSMAVAIESLVEATRRVPAESAADLASAIREAPSMRPSAIYKPQEVLR